MSDKRDVVEFERRLGSWYRLFEREELGSRWADTNIPELCIGVRRRLRGRGAGSRLVRALVERAQADGHSALDLQLGLTNARRLRSTAQVDSRRREALRRASPGCVYLRDEDLLGAMRDRHG